MVKKITLLIIITIALFRCNSNKEKLADSKLNTIETYDCLQNRNGEQIFLNKYFRLTNHNDSLYVLSPDDYKIFVTDENFLIKREIDFSDKNYYFNGHIKDFSIGKDGDIFLWDNSRKIKKLSGGIFTLVEIDTTIKEAFNIKEVQELTDSTFIISFNDLMLSQNMDSVNIGAIIKKDGELVKTIKLNKNEFIHSYDFIDDALFSIYNENIAFYFCTFNKVFTYDYHGNYLNNYELEIDRKSYFTPRKVKNNSRIGFEYFNINFDGRQVYNNNFYYILNRYPKTPRVIMYNNKFAVQRIYDVDNQVGYPTHVVKIKNKFILYFANNPLFYQTSTVQ